MKTNSFRTLAAIMFTDIVGYTAMMQENESRTREIRDIHRQVLEKKTLGYRGRILQYYGDGSLCMFSSAIEAVQCAVEIQKKLHFEESIPLRIGLHLGDIVYEEEGIYGDGVNISARIQSKGVPGSVLISGKIYDEIANHPELKASFMGAFKLKNVKKLVDIYAVSSNGLPVPDSEKMTGAENESMKRVAVLPFVNMSPDPENEYFSDGITEELLNSLAKVEGLLVTARTSSFAFKGMNQDIREIGRQLNVDTVLEGSVRKAGNQVRVTAQLINTNDGFHLFSETYDRKLDDIFAIQDEISESIAKMLKEKLNIGINPKPKPRMTTITNNIEAYNYYLKGKYYWNRWSPEEFIKAAGNFQKAIELEPEFAEAYAWLANVNTASAAMGIVDPTKAYAKAREYALKAMELNDEIAEPHAALGAVKLFHDWDFEKAGKKLDKAFSLKLHDGELLKIYALYKMITGDIYKAVSIIEDALLNDPLSVPLNNSLADYLSWTRQFDKAELQYKHTLSLDPDYGPSKTGIGWLNCYKGNYQKALEIFTKGDAGSCSDVFSFTSIGYVHGKMGNRQAALDMINKLKELKEQNPDLIIDIDQSIIYGALGDIDKTFEYLEKAYEKHLSGLLFIKIHPAWRQLDHDPRYHELIEKIGL